MATEFRAATPIRHGVSNEKGEQTGVLEFAVGDVVTGLSKADMKALWDAGALEQTEVAGAKASAPEPESSGDKSGETPQDESAKTTE